MPKPDHPYRVVVSSVDIWAYEPKWRYRVLERGSGRCLASGGGFSFGLDALDAGDREAEMLWRARRRARAQRGRGSERGGEAASEARVKNPSDTKTLYEY